jgi:hypothetical protein
MQGLTRVKAHPTAAPPDIARAGLFGAGGAASRWHSRSLRHARAHDLGAAHFWRHHLSVLVLAQRGIRSEQESVKRDTEIAQQQIRLRPDREPGALVRIAREIVTRAIDQDEFLGQAASFTRERPEINHLFWINAHARRRRAYSSISFHPRPASPARARRRCPARARRPSRGRLPRRAHLRQPVYTRPFIDSYGMPVIQVQVPLIDRAAFSGTLIAEYSVEALMRYFVPPRCRTGTRSACSTRRSRCSRARDADAGQKAQPRRRSRSRRRSRRRRTA